MSSSALRSSPEVRYRVLSIKTVTGLNKLIVPNSTEPGVQRCKCPLLACNIIANVLWTPLGFGKNVKLSNKVPFGS